MASFCRPAVLGPSVGDAFDARAPTAAYVYSRPLGWEDWPTETRDERERSIATAKVKDGAVVEDLTLKAHEVEYKLAKGSKVVEVGASEIGGERLYKLGAAVLRGLAIDPRIVWIRDAELKGDKAVALPIPQ